VKKSHYTEQQIAFALKQAETGTRIDEICRKMGISDATFYNWKKRYGGLGVSELRRLKQMEEENSRLKQIVADLTLDKQMLQDVLKKSFKAKTVEGTSGQFNQRLSGVYHTRACGVVCIHRSAWHYKSRRREDRPLRQRIKEIAAARVRYGMWRIYVLLRREGSKDNHKRVHRIYKEEGLNLRSKRPRRSKSAAHRLERSTVNTLHHCWSMDFVADQLFDGRKFLLNYIG
jgi:putative transposase